MANWVNDFLERNPDMAACAIARRAPHSIHFDMGGGNVVGYFTGAPCHYLDNGIYKPIDTTLLEASGGFYGAPHSPIRIHTDGRVKIDGTDYQQITTLPAGSSGYVDGSRIVREYPFGVQYLYIMEDKFRQKIILNREPTLTEAQAFLASEAGTFPPGYVKNELRYRDARVDSNWNDYTTLNIFRQWLATALYPVTIDPDFTATGGATYYRVRGSATSWSTAYGTSTDMSEDIQVGGGRSGSTAYQVHRAYLKFDTSAIPDGAVISAVTITMTPIDLTLCEASNNVYMYDYNWSTYDPLASGNRETVYDGLRSATQDGLWFNMDSTSVGTQYTSSALLTSWISKTGSTYYGLRGIADINNTSPPSGTTHYGYLGSPDDTTASYRPFLSITYTLPGPAKIKSINGILIASVKTVNSIASTSTKSVNGIA